MRSRPTYTPTVAYRFQYVFDELLVNKESVVINPKELGYKPRTLRLYLADTIKWLVDNEADEEKRAAYALLKSQIAIGYTLEEDKIMIRFRGQPRAIDRAILQTVNINADWRTPLMIWLQSDTNAPFYLGGLALDDKEIIQAKLLLPKHIEYTITSQSIRAVK